MMLSDLSISFFCVCWFVFFHYCHLNYRHGWPVLMGKCLTGSPPLLLHDGYVLYVMFVAHEFLSLSSHLILFALIWQQTLSGRVQLR